MKICYLLFLLLPGAGFQAAAQKQLVLLKNQDVILRLEPGDDIVFKLKTRPAVTSTYVNNIFNSSFKTHSDTIRFGDIERLYFRRTTFGNRMGQRLVTLGAGLFLIDQINVGLIQGGGFSLDSRVSRITLTSIGLGLPLMLIRKKSQRLVHPYRLLTVEKGSPFYKEDTGGLILPD